MRFDEHFEIKHLSVSLNDPTGANVILAGESGYTYLVTSYLLSFNMASASFYWYTLNADDEEQVLSGYVWPSPSIWADHSPCGHFQTTSGKQLALYQMSGDASTVSGYVNYIKMPVA